MTEKVRKYKKNILKKDVSNKLLYSLIFILIIIVISIKIHYNKHYYDCSRS